MSVTSNYRSYVSDIFCLVSIEFGRYMSIMGTIDNANGEREMSQYTVKYIDSDNELITAKTVAGNRVEAASNIKISFDVVEIIEVL